EVLDAVGAANGGRGHQVDKGPADVVEHDRPPQPSRVPAGPVGFEVDSRLALDRRHGDRAGPCRLREGERALAEEIHSTSAMPRGGQWKWVMVGLPPTVSSAISSASRSVDAGLKPRRRTARLSPPTTITAPRCCKACAHQYHM